MCFCPSILDEVQIHKSILWGLLIGKESREVEVEKGLIPVVEDAEVNFEDNFFAANSFLILSMLEGREDVGVSLEDSPDREVVDVVISG